MRNPLEVDTNIVRAVLAEQVRILLGRAEVLSKLGFASRECHVCSLRMCEYEPVALTMAAMTLVGRVDTFAFSFFLQQGRRDLHGPANGSAVTVHVIRGPHTRLFTPWWASLWSSLLGG